MADNGPPPVSLIIQPTWLGDALQQIVAFAADTGQTTRAPSPQELGAIDDLVRQAMVAEYHDDKAQATALLHQAIDQAIAAFGIDVSAVGTGADGRPRIVYGGLDTGGAYGGFQRDGSIKVYVDAVLKGQSSARFLAGILVHEVTHAKQFQAHGWADPRTQDRHAAEYMAHNASLRDENLGLEPLQRQYFEQMAQRHRAQLTPESLQRMEGGGQYWGL